MTSTLSPSAEIERSGSAFAEFMLLIVGWSIVAWLCVHMAAAHLTAQWDLAVYRRAGAAFAGGGDPYARAGTTLPFVYPPLTLPGFALLARFTAPAAYLVWLLAKALCLVVCLRVAARHFEPFRNHWTSVFFLIFAFNGALYTDVLTGNVSLMEQTLLWSAMGALLGRRYILFSCLICAAAQIKLTPLAFLLLLVLIPRRPQWRALGVAAGLMLVSVGIQWALWPGFCAGFLQQAGALRETGHLNPCTYAVASEVAAGLKGVDPLWDGSAPWIYLTLVSLAAGWAIRTWSKGRSFLEANPAWAIVFAVCLYALVVPRFKDYSYVLLLIPAWMVLRRMTLAKRWAFLPLFVLLPQPKTFLPVGGLTTQLGEYAPWVAAVLLFAAIGTHIRGHAGRAETAAVT